MRPALMHKLAVFVEGYTEVLFVERLISEIAGSHNVVVEQRKIRGGKKAKRTISTIKAARNATDEKYYVLLVDCGGEDLVKSRIIEEHLNFSNSGYQKIIGIRDVRPKFSVADIPKLELNLNKYIKTSLIPVVFILSVMEIEAWFLAEFQHFPKIHPSITLELIRKNLGFDPEQGDMALRPTPTADLRAAYLLGGQKYETGQDLERTVNALDLPYVYIELKEKIPYLRRLCGSIDGFLS